MPRHGIGQRWSQALPGHGLRDVRGKSDRHRRCGLTGACKGPMVCTPCVGVCVCGVGVACVWTPFAVAGDAACCGHQTPWMHTWHCLLVMTCRRCEGRSRHQAWVRGRRKQGLGGCLAQVGVWRSYPRRRPRTQPRAITFVSRGGRSMLPAQHMTPGCHSLAHCPFLLLPLWEAGPPGRTPSFPCPWGWSLHERMWAS